MFEDRQYVSLLGLTELSRTSFTESDRVFDDKQYVSLLSLIECSRTSNMLVY